MNTFVKTTTALGSLLLNKLASILVLLVLMRWYWSIPPVVYDTVTGVRTGGMAYSEILYTCILLLGSLTFAPFLRLLVFPEVSHFSETSGLSQELDRGKFTPWLVQYWFATALCFLICIAGLSSLAH